MGTVTAGTAFPLDMSAIDLTNLFYGTVTTATSTRFTLSYGGGDSDDFQGQGFTYNGFGEPIGGTILRYSSYVSGSLAADVVASVSVSQFMAYVRNADTVGALSLFLAGADQISGSAFADIIGGFGGDDLLQGFGGDDQLVGGLGNDTINGGNGTDYAVYGATAANYAISSTTTGWRISDPRAGANEGVDSLTSVEQLVFSDRTVNLLLTDTAINAAVSNVLRAPSTFGDFSMKVANGLLTRASAQAQVLASAATTTSVATLSYEFFTGKIPSAAGLDYLVSPTGPNPNNLNSAYYQSFNLENRYINFAVNLGRDGEGKASFATAFGGLSLLDATKAAYLKIFGSTPTDAKAHALIDSRVDYFSYYGQDGATGQGTKAAMVGWLLAEAVKADVGTYAKSNDAFLTDLLDGASYSIDLIGVYGKASFAYAG